MFLALSWPMARALVTSSALPYADVALVFSGAAVYQERLDEAARLFQEHRTAKILLTDDGTKRGWYSSIQRNPSSFEVGLMVLADAGIPRQHVEVLAGTVHSTFEEALLARKYADSHGIHSIVGVTSPYHTRRALWTLRRTFSGSGIQVGIEPAEPSPLTPSYGSWWWRPRGWQMVAGEYIKFAFYWLYYR